MDLNINSGDLDIKGSNGSRDYLEKVKKNLSKLIVKFNYSKKMYYLLPIIIIGIIVYMIYKYLILPDIWLKNERLPLNMNLEYFELNVEEIEPNYSEKFDKALELLNTQLPNMQLSKYLVVVDISEQKEYIYDNSGNLLYRYKISTGSDIVRAQQCENSQEEVDGEIIDREQCSLDNISREMKPSVWKLSNKISGNLDPLYGPRIMMLDKRVGGNWVVTQVGLHGTNQPELLGSPESLGCIYHENADIIELFEILEVGDYVVAIE